MSKRVFSPICQSQLAEIIEYFPPDEIIKAYSKIGIDVSSYFKGIEIVYLYKCTRTGYRFYYPSTIFGTSALYDELQKRPGYYRIKNEHKRALDFISKGSKVLEIGCGEGLFLNLLIGNEIKAQGIEVSEDAVKKAKTAGLPVSKNNIISFAKYNNEAFDVICAFQVLEHVVDVKEFIDGALKLLSTGGKLIIGVPNSNPYIFRGEKLHALNLPPHHMGLWNQEALKRLELYFGMRLVTCEVEPLESNQLLHYIAVNITKISPLVARLLQVLLSAIRPYCFGKTLFRIITRKIEGRNIIAIFEKIPI